MIVHLLFQYVGQVRVIGIELLQRLCLVFGEIGQAQRRCFEESNRICIDHARVLLFIVGHNGSDVRHTSLRAICYSKVSISKFHLNDMIS